jgi:hypothetical protein
LIENQNNASVSEHANETIIENILQNRICQAEIFGFGYSFAHSLGKVNRLTAVGFNLTKENAE